MKDTAKDLKVYLLGFSLCIFLTLAAYFLVSLRFIQGIPLLATILGIGTVQAVVQMVIFLHLGREEDYPRWNFLTFLFMLSVLLIIVLGSIWIMKHLNYNVMMHD